MTETENYPECETCRRATAILVFIAFVLTLGIGAMGLWTYTATHDLKAEIVANRSERNDQITILETRIEELASKCR